MKSRLIPAAAVLLVTIALPCIAGTLKMPNPPELSVDAGAPRHIAISVAISDQLKNEEYVVRTSPFDKIKYPIGAYTSALLQKNIDLVFDSVTILQPGQVPSEDTLLATLTIERFEAVIPNPAYKPYTADVIYRITLTDAEGNTVFTASAVGSAQTSKGMMSGFKAQQLAAHAATQAMDEAMAEILNSLAASVELDDFELQDTHYSADS